MQIPKIRSRWKHFSGTVYTVIQVANTTIKEHDPDFPIMIIYINIQKIKSIVHALCVQPRVRIEEEDAEKHGIILLLIIGRSRICANSIRWI